MGFAWLGRVPGRVKGIPMKQRKWLNRVAAMAAAAATLLTEGLVADTALAAETGLAHAKTVTLRCGDGHDSVAFRVFVSSSRYSPRSSGPCVTECRTYSSLCSRSMSLSCSPQTSPMRSPPTGSARWIDRR